MPDTHRLPSTTQGAPLCASSLAPHSVSPSAAYRWCQPTTWIDPVEARAALEARIVETDERPIHHAAPEGVWAVHPEPLRAEPGQVVALFAGQTLRVEVERHRPKGPLSFWLQVTGNDQQVIARGGFESFDAAMKLAREALERFAAGTETDHARCAS